MPDSLESIASGFESEFNTNIDNPLASYVPTFRGLVTRIRAMDAYYLAGLPTADPHVAGKLWNNGGVLTVSAG